MLFLYNDVNTRKEVTEVIILALKRSIQLKPESKI